MYTYFVSALAKISFVNVYLNRLWTLDRDKLDNYKTNVWMKNINRTFNPIERFFESKFELWKQQQIQRREPPLKFKKVKRDQESYKKIKKSWWHGPLLAGLRESEMHFIINQPCQLI